MTELNVEQAEKCRRARAETKTVEAMAKELNISVRQFYNWKKDGVPPHRVLDYCQVTGERPEEVWPRGYPPCCNEVMGEYLKRYGD